MSIDSPEHMVRSNAMSSMQLLFSALIVSAGMVPGYEITQWWALMGPAGLPPTIVTRLNSEVNAILQQQDVKERFAVEGAETAPQTPDWLASYMKSEVAKWATVVRASGATAD